MKAIFSILSLLMIAIPCTCAAGDSVCNPIYNELAGVPHTKLELNANGFHSIWGGEFMNGCEIVFESDESIVSGELVYQKFEAIINMPGWVMDNTKCADGPGSSIQGIMNGEYACIIHWEQGAWIDENNEHQQSDEIQLIVQCTVDNPDGYAGSADGGEL